MSQAHSPEPPDTDTVALGLPLRTPPGWGSPDSLTGRVYKALKQRIVTCEFAPNARLSAKDLCAELGISHTPFREALNRLVLEGLVVTVPYRGYVVATLDLDDIRDLCELREMVEAEIAGLAARRGDHAIIASLKPIAETRYTHGDVASYWRYMQANSDFHLGIAQAAGNRRLETVLAQVLDHVHRPSHLALDASNTDPAEAVEEHLTLVDQLLHGDERGARRTAIKHCKCWSEQLIAIATRHLATQEQKQSDAAEQTSAPSL
jgi:DNA-binding GntR family transcriptional regulator